MKIQTLFAVLILFFASCTKEDDASFSSGSSYSGTSSNCPSVQCSATTQAGSRCTRKTTNCNGRCWQHQ